MAQPAVGRVPDGATSDDPRRHVRPLVGRDAELAELRSALAEGASGRGSILMVCGEPGIGKSRLTEELAAGAVADGWQVLSGRCWDGGGAPAYWPWVQVVRAAGGEFDRLGPLLEADGAPGRRSGASESADPEAARFELFDQVGRFLAATPPGVRAWSCWTTCTRPTNPRSCSCGSWPRRRRDVSSSSARIAPIEHTVVGGVGTIRIPGVLEAEMDPYRSPAGGVTTLRDSVFSTVPGSPAWVSKASRNLVTLQQYGMEWEFEGRNAIQADWKMEHVA